MKVITWTLKDLTDILTGRQHNEFDGNFAVSGERGNGKSTLINKIFYRFKIFRPWKHQVYNGSDVIRLLKGQTLGLCWDDEAINSGYKRNWQDKTQQELIKTLTVYRDNYNIYASAIPNFFSLDKDLRDLYFIHLHVIERGIAIVHMPLQGRLYSQDKWDVKYNAKVEDSWGKRMQKDTNFKPPYHKLSTFKGYLFFGDATPKQKELYKQIKKKKREDAFLTNEEKAQNKEISFIERVYDLLINHKLTSEGIFQMCLLDGKKHSSISSSLNRMLKDNGENKTVKDFLQQPTNKGFHSKVEEELLSIIPDI